MSAVNFFEELQYYRHSRTAFGSGTQLLR